MEENDKQALVLFRAAIASLAEKEGGKISIPIYFTKKEDTIFYHVEELGNDKYIMHVNLVKSAPSKRH